MAVKIISDSSAGVSRDVADSMGITVVPCYVLIDDVTYREGVDINREEFYARLQTSARLPTTSQPTPGDFSERIDPLVSDGHQVLCITLARQLSGTYNSAVQAAQGHGDDKVRVVDATTASVGHMLQVVAAAEDAAKPDATLDAVAQAAEERAKQGFGYCVVDTLEFLQKGGRIGKAQAFMGSLLKVKPILRVSEGEVLPIDRPRNLRRAMQRLEELVREHQPVSKVGVAYTTDADAARQMQERLSDLAPADQRFTIQIGSAVGTHVGPGALAVATLA